MNARWLVDNADEVEKILPGFDPFRLGKVELLEVKFDPNGSISSRVFIEYWSDDAQELVVELVFFGIRQMKIPELGPSIFELSELEVRDIGHHGLEGIQREVIDHGADRFFLLCRSVAITNVFVRDGDAVTTLWTSSTTRT